MTNSIATSMSGVGVPAAGMGASASDAGLGGLFAALMGGAEAANTTTMNGMMMVRMNGSVNPAAQPVGGMETGTPVFDVSAFLAAQGGVQQDVQLEDGAPALTVTGDAETVAEFISKVKEIYQKVILDGGLKLDTAGDAEELAGALAQLGLSEEDALGVAERIQTMLKLLEQNHDKIDEETAGSLVAMMLAVMGQEPVVAKDGEATEQPLSVQLTAASQTVTVANFPATAWRGANDVTRDLLGLNTAAAPAPQSDAEAGPKTFVVAVARDTAEATIGMELPEVAKVPVKDVPTVAADVTRDALDAGARAVQVSKVEMSQLVEAPEGESYYRLQADKDGVETVQALKPLTDVAEVSPEALRDSVPVAARAEAAAAASAAGAAPATGATSFAHAERVAQVQAMLDNAGIAKQVAVQILPLAEQGGGTVRMILNPVELGQITVELKIADGKVHGSIAASDPAVMEQLARELHSLRHGLADAGLKVSEQGIDLMLSNQNHQGQGGQSQQEQHAHAGSHGSRAPSGNGSATGGEAGNTAALADNLAAWVSPDRMLDVNV